MKSNRDYFLLNKRIINFESNLQKSSAVNEKSVCSTGEKVFMTFIQCTETHKIMFVNNSQNQVSISRSPVWKGHKGYLYSVKPHYQQVNQSTRYL